VDQKLKEGLVNSSRTCAYCDVGTDLTNEHILPNTYHKFAGNSIDIVKTPSGDKAVSSAQKIGDVCAACNNGPLSRLDSYLAELIETYFSKIVHSGDQIRFHYEFDPLLKLLLKILFNVARTRNWPLQTFQNCKRYILGKEKLGTSGFRIFLQLLIPTPVAKTELPVTPGTKEIPPLPWHTELYDVGGLAGLVFACSISFRSYRFFVLKEDSSLPPVVRLRSIVKWLRENKGASEIKKSKTEAIIYASSVTVIDAVKESPVFYDQLQKARKLKSDMELKSRKN
jgi:hypothetical protein